MSKDQNIIPAKFDDPDEEILRLRKNFQRWPVLYSSVKQALVVPDDFFAACTNSTETALYIHTFTQDAELRHQLYENCLQYFDCLDKIPRELQTAELVQIAAEHYLQRSRSEIFFTHVRNDLITNELVIKYCSDRFYAIDHIPLNRINEDIFIGLAKSARIVQRAKAVVDRAEKYCCMSKAISDVLFETHPNFLPAVPPEHQDVEMCFNAVMNSDSNFAYIRENLKKTIGEMLAERLFTKHPSAKDPEYLMSRLDTAKSEAEYYTFMAAIATFKPEDVAPYAKEDQQIDHFKQIFGIEVACNLLDVSTSNKRQWISSDLEL